MTDQRTGERPAILDHETRFAVVMYGGVSLAIYINGVAQELYSLVRSTAPGDESAKRAWLSDKELVGAEPIYRAIAREADGGFSQESEPEKESELAPLRTRYLIDIISGTSAGGINGIFLAKALVNGSPLKPLENLWMTQGDMELLLNDHRSYDRMPPGYQPNPATTSLINSQRMYYQLVNALKGLDEIPERRGKLAEDLGLAVTATDLGGFLKRIQLYDKEAYERSYRAFFHFKHDPNKPRKPDENPPREPFAPADTPFLAFVARCTSSFPLAFEPMLLEDVLEVAGDTKTSDVWKKSMEDWARYFDEYLYEDTSQDPANSEGSNTAASTIQRPFGDGGYLDNKPFGYAIDALGSRQSSVVVDRKLLYVEPSPEHPEQAPGPIARPNAFQNLALAATTIPRTETIREDLDRVRVRNRTIEKIDRATRDLEDDIEYAFDKDLEKLEVPWIKLAKPPELTSADVWGRFWLPEVIHEYGPAVGPYHRLKVATLTSELADMVAQAKGVDENSQERLAIRYVVSAWRQARYQRDLPREYDFKDKERRKARSEPNGLPIRYPEKAEDGNEILSENQFLFLYDLPYRMRRISYLQCRIDELLRLDPIGIELAWRIFKQRTPPRNRDGSIDPPPELRPLRTELVDLKAKLSDIWTCLHERQTELFTRRSKEERSGSKQERNPLTSKLEKLDVRSKEFLRILQPRGARARSKAATELIRRHGLLASLDEAADALANLLEVTFTDASKQWEAAIVALSDSPLRKYLKSRYESYDRFDVVLFELQYGTNVGEGQQVETIRISPEDATLLIEEKPKEGPRIRKLAGTFLANFGGFLYADWRANDILWGRLDGADRLIQALVPGETKANRYSLAAQLCILRQAFKGLTDDQARRRLVEFTLRAEREEEGRAALQAMTEHLRDALGDETVGRFMLSSDIEHMRRILDVAELNARFRTVYRLHRGLPPEQSLRLLSRSTSVFGRLLDHESNRSAAIGKTVAAYLLMAGRMLWAFVEVAVPGRFWSLAADWWWKLAYALTALMTAVGWFLANREVRDLGFRLFAAVFAVDLLRRAIGLQLAMADEAWVAERGLHDRPKRRRWLPVAILGLELFFLGALSGLPLGLVLATPPERSWWLMLLTGAVLFELLRRLARFLPKDSATDESRVATRRSSPRQSWSRMRGALAAIPLLALGLALGVMLPRVPKWWQSSSTESQPLLTMIRQTFATIAWWEYALVFGLIGVVLGFVLGRKVREDPKPSWQPRG